MIYRVAQGVDTPLIDLVALDPQPRCEGLKYGRQSFAASGQMYLEAPYAELVWDVIESQADYEALLAQFGLDTLISADITITLPNALYESQRFNATAHRPVAGQSVRHSQYFIRDVTILLRDIESSS